MIFEFDDIAEIELPHLHGGELSVFERRIDCGKRRISYLRVPGGASVGSHLHLDDDEIDYVIKGEGCVVINECVEFLKEGSVHICHARSIHSILNTSEEDLILLSIVSS